MNLINKLKKPIKQIALGISLSLSTITAYTQNRSIEFYGGNFENAKNEAKNTNKLIFMDGYAVWCGPCKKMDKEVFTNDSVADFYNKNFLNIKMDMESEEGKKIKKLFSIGAYPTFLYINGEGKLLHKGVGWMKSPEFIKLGKEASDPKTQLATFNEKYEEGNRDGEFIYEYLKKLDGASISYEYISKDYFKTQKDEDLNSRVNWNILFINKNNTDINSETFNYLIKNKIKFDEIYTSDSVDEKIFNAYSSNFNNILYKKSFNDSIYQEWKNKIKEQNFSRVDGVLLEADLQYNEKIKNWEEYANNAILLIDKHNRNYSADKLNDVAWTFFKNVKNKDHLEKALNWSENSVKIADNPNNNDTYACLLYVLGDTAKAIQIEEKAIRLAKETESNKGAIERFSKKFEKMKAGEKLD